MAEAEGWDNPQHEEAVLGDVLVPFAQARIDTQFGDVDALDGKALNGVGLAAGAVALTTPAQPSTASQMRASRHLAQRFERFPAVVISRSGAGCRMVASVKTSLGD